MAKTLKAGDRVSWSSHGGSAHGKVVKKLTSLMSIKGHKSRRRRTIRSISSKLTTVSARRTSRDLSGRVEDRFSNAVGSVSVTA